MDWEEVKKSISKEIGSTINTIDPAFDVNICLDLYLKILNHNISFNTKDDLDGLGKNKEKTLKENFMDNHVNSTSIGNFCKNFEPFVKKVYYILVENNFIKSEYLLDSTKLLTLVPFLSVFNKVRPIYIDKSGADVYDIELALLEKNIPKIKIDPGSKSPRFKRLYPSTLLFNDYLDVDNRELNHEYQNNFLLHLIKSVILKNEQSHQVPDRSKLKNIENLNSTLLTELWIIDFFKKELTSCFRNKISRGHDFSEYFSFEIKRLEKQSSKFVSLSLKELSAETSNGRSGFIEDLLVEDLQRIRVLGQGGSGKTTTLEYLLFQDIKNCIKNPKTSKVPVLISLAGISNGETIMESISKKINIDIDYLEELLETNMLKIYLDGINEIVNSREEKKIIVNEIATILDEYPKLSVIITDRFEFDSYQNNMFQIPTFLIQKLDQNQIKEFVEKYCFNVKEVSSNVLKILKSKKNIQELLSRPLLLTRAIEIIKIDNYLPEKEGQIIEKFIDMLLKREKDEKKDPLLNIDNFKLLLSYAAQYIWHKSQSNTPLHAFKFNKLLVEGADKFGLERFNAGYITRIGYELEILSKNGDLIQFYHQSYLEFFCKHFLKYEIY